MIEFGKFLIDYIDSAFEGWRGRIWTISLVAALSLLAVWAAVEVYPSAYSGPPRTGRLLCVISTFTLIGCCAILWPRKKSKPSAKPAPDS